MRRSRRAGDRMLARLAAVAVIGSLPVVGGSGDRAQPRLEAGAVLEQSDAGSSAAVVRFFVSPTPVAARAAAAPRRRAQAAADCLGAWGAWSACDIPCDSGMRERAFAATSPAAAGGRECVAADGGLERALAPECAAPCDVHCVGSWSDWSPCSQPCGGGVRSRSFAVSVAASGAGAACGAADLAHDEGSCNVQACDVVADCVGGWGQWSACDAPCGGGIRTRNYLIETTQQNGGSMGTCDIAASRIGSESEACNANPCAVDCTGAWGDWQGCTDPCARNAMAERSYIVTVPAAEGTPDLYWGGF